MREHISQEGGLRSLGQLLLSAKIGAHVVTIKNNGKRKYKRECRPGRTKGMPINVQAINLYN